MRTHISYEEKTALKEKYLIRHGMCPIIGVGLILVLTVLSPAMVSVQPADAQTYTISSCGDCHSDPPIDGTRDATTGAVVGSHNKHASSTEYYYDCSVCHVSVTRTPTPAYNHRNSNINMISPLNAHSGSYNNPSGITFPQTKTPTLYNCSNTYCHSTGVGGTSQTGESRSVATNTSPTWGNNGTITCNSCHGKETGNDGTGRPHYTSGSPKANSHELTKHGALTCDKCHNATTSTGNTVTNKANHANRVYNVDGTGTEPFTFTYAYASTGGGCATGYCHGTASPAWGTTGTLACASCHSSMGSGGAAAYTGKHQKHVDTTGYDYSCEMCHSQVNGTVHVDGPVVSANQSVQVTFRNSTTGAFVTGQTYNGSVSTYKYRSLAHNPYSAEGAVTPAYAPAGTIQTDGSLKWRDAGSCSTVWCHSNANPMLRGAETSLNTYRSVAFNATTGCTACHLGPGAYATMTTATDRLSTTHAKHLATDWYGQNVNFTCSTCHTNTASNNTTISNIANHVNAAKDVAIWATVDSDTTPTNNWTSPNCSSVYCHSSGDRLGVTPTIEYRTVAWSSTITGCTACHNGPDTYANMTGATGANRMSAAHAKHIATTTPGHGANTNFTCNSCHTGVADNNTTINTTTGYGLHVNKAKNVSLNTFASGTWSGSPNNNCSNTYCHSIGIGGTTNSGETRTIQANTSIAWTAGSSCTSCHASPPNYPNNDAAYQNKRNSHTAGTHASLTCDKCHNQTTTTGNTVTNPANHVNKLYNVNPGTGITLTYAYDVGGGSCSSITGPGGCHGTAQWGVTQIDCISCHSTAQDAGDGAPTRRAVTDASGGGEFSMAWSHKRTASTSATYPTAAGRANKYDCGVCHMEGDAATGAVNATYHKNNAVDLRDPDTGTAISSFTSFTRDTASASLETHVTNVQNLLCLKCHDAGGAASATARVPGGTALRPFGTAPTHTSGNNVLDVDAQFATTNATFHPIKGPQNNPYCNVNTMNAPWNTKAAGSANPVNGPVISCWDCHVALNTAHGGTATLRASFPTYAASATSTTTVNGSTGTLCSLCHNDAIYITSGLNNSAFGGGSQGGLGNPDKAQHGTAGRMPWTCVHCHGSSWADPGRPTRAQDAHGFNAFTAGGSASGGATWTGGSKPYAFLRMDKPRGSGTDGRWSSWRPRKDGATTNATWGCSWTNASGLGACNRSEHLTSFMSYGPGGVF